MPTATDHGPHLNVTRRWLVCFTDLLAARCRSVQQTKATAGWGNQRTDDVTGWSTGERQDGAAAGNGFATVATLLPPDFNGTTAGKHARVDEST